MEKETLAHYRATDGASVRVVAGEINRFGEKDTKGHGTLYTTRALAVYNGSNLLTEFKFGEDLHQQDLSLLNPTIQIAQHERIPAEELAISLSTRVDSLPQITPEQYKAVAGVFF